LYCRRCTIDTATQEQAWNSFQMAEPVTQPRFRVWTYRTPTIVLGCSQRARQAALAPQLPLGVEMLVRPSGGGAVLTGPWMVSASVVLPLSHPWAQGRLPDSYRDLGQLHGEVLADLGVAAQALPEADVPAANARLGAAVNWACYGSLAPWELVDAAGRKLVGLAQRRQRTGVLLVAGTLATPPDWTLLCGAMGQPDDVGAMHRRTVDCASLADRPWNTALLAERLQQALARMLTP
jgi:lipoate-protein ligase A